VTAVGGTTLNRASNARGWAESAWGGWRQRRKAPAARLQQVLPEADLAEGQALYDAHDGRRVGGGGSQYGRGGLRPLTGLTSGWQVYGGTSVAAPLIGGLYGANGGTVVLGSPYGAGSRWNDVTFGSNGKPNAGGLAIAAAPTSAIPTRVRWPDRPRPPPPARLASRLETTCDCLAALDEPLRVELRELKARFFTSLRVNGANRTH